MFHDICNLCFRACNEAVSSQKSENAMCAATLAEEPASFAANVRAAWFGTDRCATGALAGISLVAS